MMWPPVARFDHALQRQVVGFGSAAGEDDLPRRGAGQFRDPLAGQIDCLLGFPAKAVTAAGGVAELRSKVGQHRFEHPRVHRRGGVMVEVDGLAHGALSHCDAGGVHVPVVRRTAIRRYWSYRRQPARMPRPVISPETEVLERDQLVPLYRVVLLDDNDHTYDYVIEMLQKIFIFTLDQAYRHAEEVDRCGRTVLITCELGEAEFARDQIHSYGADWRLPRSKGSMSAVIEPAAGEAS